MTLYLLSTALSPVLSTHRMVKLFGVLALLSFGAAYAFYATWFISVWCFFAALRSPVVYLHFALRARENPSPVRAAAQPAVQTLARVLEHPDDGPPAAQSRAAL